ncbi:dihydrolipoyl dehydrogenase [Pararhodobacter sp. SW119]|uniref:dihydrolipoyl dehydrogenase n=1 Tax=Pararhodobacter sp. SW119 TaxID=2780075 RepID=UPI001AE06D4F|nr:dihydrolipoyl dehydrogenase [Pararhodobacter sp. SW119]
MKELTCKLLVIGAGPGGYVCAIRAGQLGVDTIIVEAEKPGGTCLTVGCIPSKAMIHAADEFAKLVEAAAGGSPFGLTAADPVLDLAKAVAWKDGIVGKLTSGVAGLLKRAGVKTVAGWARFRDGKTVEVETETGVQVIRAEAVVIATGSVPVELPSLPFGDRVISSTGALELTELPERLVVVGAGYIGLELGTAFAKLGSRVTVVEAEGRVLPLWDADLTKPVAKRLAELGVEVLTGAKARRLSSDGAALVIEDAEGEERRLPADKLLVTVGRRPLVDGWGLEELDLDRDGRFIRIDEQCRTSMRGVYAIGDLTGEPMLAHRAMAQGEMVAEIVAGNRRGWDKRAIPAVCFTDPEVVSVGLSPDEARATGREIKTGSFPFSANGRAMTLGSDAGFVRVIARADNHLVLGIQAVGQGVAELSAAFALAIEMGARIEDVAGTIHAHPTQSEAFPEAALKALGHALHI